MIEALMFIHEEAWQGAGGKEHGGAGLRVICVVLHAPCSMLQWERKAQP